MMVTMRPTVSKPISDSAGDQKTPSKTRWNRPPCSAPPRGNKSADIDRLPIGEVIQVYSLYCEVDHPTGQRLCVVRKTLNKLADSAVIVGDQVRFRDTEIRDESGRPEAVVEQVLPRRTLLTRSDSFSGRDQHPIVANAQQMLIVASFLRPTRQMGTG